MEIKIAPCGLVCSQCDAYRATRANDAAGLERVADAWRKLNQCDEIQAESLRCDGCMTDGGRKCGYCGMCGIRACAVVQGVQVCSECTKYPCGKVTDFLNRQPQGQAEAMKQMLDGIAAVETTMKTVL